MKQDDWNWIIVGLLVAIIAMLYAAFAEIFARLRPRVVYVHQGGGGSGHADDDTREPAA